MKAIISGHRQPFCMLAVTTTLILLLANLCTHGAVYDVGATRETEPVPETGDIADDICIWLHPTNAALSLIIGTDKHNTTGGLYLYNLDGTQHAALLDGKMNNVDVLYNFPLNAEQVDIVAAGNRTDAALVVYKVDPATRTLSNVTAGAGIPLGTGASSIDIVYGTCLYRSPSSGEIYAFVSDKDGDVEQWRLFDTGSNSINAALVRGFDAGDISEGLAADYEYGALYVGEEDVGIWRYGAEPGDGTNRVAVDNVTDGRLAADVEGLCIYYMPGKRGYLIASSQGEDVGDGHQYKSTYAVYDRRDTNAYLCSFRIVSNSPIDDVTNTDGIDVTSAPLGDGFPFGCFIAQDDANPGTNQNFKLVPWHKIVQAGDTPLSLNMSWDPRAADNNLPRAALAPPAKLNSLTVNLTVTNLVGEPAGHSDCCIMPSTGELLGVDNHGRKRIDVFDLDGTYLRYIPTTNFADIEGLVHLYGDTFAAVDETGSDITFLQITANTTNIARSDGVSFHVPITNAANAGFEGLTYDPDNDWFYAVSENPMPIHKVVCQGTSGVATVLFDASDGLGGRCTDFMDIVYEPHSKHLFFMSDLSHNIVETDLAGTVLSERAPPENTGEGMTFSADLSELFLIQQVGTLHRYDVAWPAPGGAEDQTNVTLQVYLSAASAKTATVAYAAGTGSTAAGTGLDYTMPDGVLTFLPGDTNEMITITVLDDAEEEDNETIVCRLHSPGNAALRRGGGTNTYTIEDNDYLWAAYNDLAWFAAQTNDNITTYTTTNGAPARTRQGLLVNYDTGAPLGVTLTVSGGSAPNEGQGNHPAEGTDAHGLFDGRVDCKSTVTYTSDDANDLVLTFTGLDPDMRYEFASYSDRGVPSYGGRLHYGTISDVASFENASSAGTQILTKDEANDTTQYVAGYNTQNGFVTRFINIDPGTNGTFLVTFDRDVGASRYSYANAVMLRAGAGAWAPESWKTKYFSSPPNPAAAGDDDNDGLSNEGEYVSGCVPTNDTSYFAVDVLNSNGQAVVSFPTVKTEGSDYTGYDRYYDLEERTNLTAGADWTGVAGFTNILGTNQTVTYTPGDTLMLYRGKTRLERQ